MTTILASLERAHTPALTITLSISITLTLTSAYIPSCPTRTLPVGGGGGLGWCAVVGRMRQKVDLRQLAVVSGCAAFQGPQSSPSPFVSCSCEMACGIGGGVVDDDAARWIIENTKLSQYDISSELEWKVG